jgi:hypothetical protein
MIVIPVFTKRCSTEYPLDYRTEKGGLSGFDILGFRVFWKAGFLVSWN